MTLISDFSFTQMVTEPTRHDNVLDLFLTSNHTLVQKVEIYPGIADHDVMVTDVNIKTLGRQEPRSVPLYRKANWDSFREYISVFASDLIRNCPNKTVEMWNSFKSAIDQGISKFVPIKRFGTKKSLPWITQEMKRLARKCDKLFQLQKKTGRSKDRHHFKQVKYLVQSKIRSAYDNYLQDLLGLAAQSAEENPSGFIPKKLYSLIKNARQDSQGISSLFDKKENTLVTENKAKKLKPPF